MGGLEPAPGGGGRPTPARETRTSGSEAAWLKQAECETQGASAPFVVLGLTRQDIAQRILSSPWMRVYYIVCICATLTVMVYIILVGWTEEWWLWVTEVVLISAMCVEAAVRSWLLGCSRCSQSGLHLLDCALCVAVVLVLAAHSISHLDVSDAYNPALLAPRFLAQGVVMACRHRQAARKHSAGALIVLPEVDVSFKESQFSETPRLSKGAYGSLVSDPAAAPMYSPEASSSTDAYGTGRGSVGSLSALAGFGKRHTGPAGGATGAATPPPGGPGEPCGTSGGDAASECAADRLPLLRAAPGAAAPSDGRRWRHRAGVSPARTMSI